jgi:hypothetical protein
MTKNGVSTWPTGDARVPRDGLHDNGDDAD